MQSSLRVAHPKVQRGLSPKLLAAFVAFVAGREIFELYTKVGGWLASLVGLGIWSAVMYLTPPRPKLWALLLATASLALIVIVLHLFHLG
jgi:hypothetical protein